MKPRPIFVKDTGNSR